MVNGSVESVCTAHKTGKAPVVRIEIHDDTIDDYGDFKRYLEEFVSRELNGVHGVKIYGAGGQFARMATGIFSWEHDIELCDERDDFTHIFIAWDFEDPETFSRLDDFLARGIVLNSVTI